MTPGVHTTGEGATLARGPGRPRDARAGVAILEAAARVLAAVGPQGFTVDAVAASAGVGKATIYRRWPTRATLLLEAASRLGLELTDPDTGSLRDDLVEHLVALGTKLRTTPSGPMLAGIISEAAVNDEMRPHLRRWVTERRAVAQATVERGVARGELPAGTDVGRLLDLLGGMVFFRFLTNGPAVERPEVEWLVDTVLAGARSAASVPADGSPDPA
ncbi:MAG TPA: TetR/AcrR family transcriptional regulator [Acidimicrobiales bacterium]|nr:TetR/AcrR family transcriptional regulator [Acidimicrobiales bacterium]